MNANTEQAPKSPPPPYGSFSTLVTFLDSLRPTAPSRIDNTLMTKYSGTAQSTLKGALRFFGLVTEDFQVTPLLHRIVEGAETESKELFQKVFTDAYNPLLNGINMERATIGELQEVFRAQGFTGETIVKCVAFYLAGAEFAGIKLSPHLNGSKSRGTGTRRPRGRKPVANRQPSATEVSQPPVSAMVPQAEEDSIPPGHAASSLLLDASGSRTFRLIAPVTVTSAELKRIQAWLGFQLIVDDGTSEQKISPSP